MGVGVCIVPWHQALSVATEISGGSRGSNDDDAFDSVVTANMQRLSGKDKFPLAYICRGEILCGPGTSLFRCAHEHMWKTLGEGGMEGRRMWVKLDVRHI